jgi:hypothetical protein
VRFQDSDRSVPARIITTALALCSIILFRRRSKNAKGKSHMTIVRQFLPTLRPLEAVRSVAAMMRVYSANFSVSTRGKGTYEITDKVESAIRESG